MKLVDGLRLVDQSDCTGRTPGQCWDCDCPLEAEHMHDCRQPRIEAVRVALLAMDQAVGTMRWIEDTVPGTNLKSDIILLDRAIELLRS